MSAATLKPAKDWYWTAATVRSRSGIAFQRAVTGFQLYARSLPPAVIAPAASACTVKPRSAQRSRPSVADAGADSEPVVHTAFATVAWFAGTVASTVQVVVASASEGRTTSSARNLFMCDLLSACEERAHRAGFRYQSVIVTTSTCPASRREARPVMNVWNSLVSICVEDGDDALMPWPMMTIVA